MSDFLFSTLCLGEPPTLSYVLEAYSFSLPYSIPLCDYNIICPSVLPVMDIRVDSSSEAVTIGAGRDRNILVMIHLRVGLRDMRWTVFSFN